MLHSTPRPHLAAVLGTGLLAACGSSSSGGGGTQAPPAQELPDEYSVFIADFDFNGISRPYLFDMETGERRRAVASLPAGVGLQGQFSEVSPDGRFLVVNLEDTGTGGELLRIINLETGGTRTPSFPSGFAPRLRSLNHAPASLFGDVDDGDPLEGGQIGGTFEFSADSSFALIQRSFSEQYLSDGDGRNITPLLVDGEPAFSLGWIGSSNRILLATENPVNFSSRVTILDAETGAVSHFDPAPGEIVYLDEARLSGDAQFVLVAMEASGTPGIETEDLFVIDLQTGDTTRWTVPGLECRSIRISDDGSRVAFVADDPATQEPRVSIGETSTGASEVVSAPANMPSETDVRHLQFEPGGVRLAFSSNHRDEEIEEITVAAFGGASTAIDPTLPQGTDVEDFAWSPAGRFLAYVMDGPGVDQVFVHDADSTSLPIAVSDSATVARSTEFTWSPSGDRILVLEEISGTSQDVTSMYSGPNWSERRVLGDGWRFGLTSETPETFRSVRFSPDGARVIWQAFSSGSGGSFVEALDLWGAALADPAGTEATLLTGGESVTSPPIIENFWLRATPPDSANR
ncbi:MAG: hypothetical protein AAGG01_19030 [Planctomycetota bacterium]